jgi:hypothetical protein
MSDLFSAYGEAKAPPRRAPYGQRKAPASLQEVKPLSAFDQKMEEKERLSRRYRATKRAEAKRILGSEPRLPRFIRYLRTITAETAGELVEAVRDSWLLQCDPDVRLFALRMVDARANKINRSFGIGALDDPLPPETSVFFLVKGVLGVR